MKYNTLTNYISGEFSSSNGQLLDVFSPLSGEIISRVPLSSTEIVDKAVRAAEDAFPDWSAMPIKERVQIFFRYKYLLEKHLDELAAVVSEENGKTMDEAVAEVNKSIEVTEFACALPQLSVGEVEIVSRGVECRSERHPLASWPLSHRLTSPIWFPTGPSLTPSLSGIQ